MLETSKTEDTSIQWISFAPCTGQKIAFLVAALFAAAAVGMYFVSPAAAYGLGSLSIALLIASGITSICQRRSVDHLEHLKWENISLMLQSDHALGLANVEFWEEGHTFKGKALNLDFTAPGVYRNYPTENKSKDTGTLFSKLTFQDKKSILKLCEDGIDAYINECTDPTFLLIDYGSLALHATQMELGQSLGFVGKEVAYSNEVKVVIPPPQEPLKGKALHDYYHNAIVLAIRGYAQEVKNAAGRT